MTARLPSPVGRHRGAHRDPLGTALTGFWVLGHVAAALLLGTSVLHASDSGQLAPQAAQSASDRALSA
jgi:hypothetical protein